MKGAFELATELMEAFGRDGPDGNPDTSRSRITPDGIGPVRDVPVDVATDRADLLDTLGQRTSIRFFGDRPVTAGHISSVIARGVAADARSWPDEQDHGALETTIVALRVEGLEPGIHRVERGGRRYVPVAPLWSGGSTSDLTLQREFAGSAAIISIGADLDRAVDRHGSHGYRLLMGRAGSAAYTMWLEAVATELVGTVFAGFIPAAVRHALRNDGTSRAQLFAFALGHPLAATQ